MVPAAVVEEVAGLAGVAEAAEAEAEEGRKPVLAVVCQ